MDAADRLLALAGTALIAAQLGAACRPVEPDRATPGVVVERMQQGYGGARAGLRPDDVLVGWRPASAVVGESGFIRSLRSPMDFDLLELGPAQLEPVEIVVRTDGSSRTMSLPLPPWRTDVRPALAPAFVERLRQARELIAQGETEQGIAGLQAVAEAVEPRSVAAACWLWLEVALQQADTGALSRATEARARAFAAARSTGAKRLLLWVWTRAASGHEQASEHERAAEAYERALRLAPRDGPLRATLQLRFADARFRAGDTAGAQRAYSEAHEAWRSLSPASPGLAATLIGLGKTARNHGRFEVAERRLAAAVRVARAASAHHPQLAIALQEWGTLADWRDELGKAERRFTASHALYRRLGIRDRHLAALLMGRGNVARNRGDLTAAEADFLRAYRIFRRDVPGSIFVAWSLQGLGVVAWDRGEWNLAEQRNREALEILETLHPDSMDAALVLDKLGLVSRDRGDLVAAREHFARALAIVESRGPESKFPPRMRTNLGRVALALGELAVAERLLTTAHEEWERRVPGSLDQAITLHALGELALRRGELSQARRRHREALAIRSILAPRTALEGRSLHALAIVERTAARPERARDLLYAAIAALEAQVAHSGGSDESRARFRSRYTAIYKDLVGLLVELGDPAAAFEVLERHRTQDWRSTLAEHRPVLGRDLPVGLLRERERIALRIAAIRRELESLDTSRDNRSRVRGLVARLRELHQERQGLLARVESEAPGAAALVEPRPVRLADLPTLLPADAVVVSYDLRETGSALYVVDAGGRVDHHDLGVDERTLRDRVRRLRLLLAREGPGGAGRDALTGLAAELYELLLAPAEPRIASASRVVVLPDGVLHLLPFAALVRYAGDGTARFLAEWKAVSVAPSLDGLRGRRRSPARDTVAPPRELPRVGLVAFGDPRIRRSGAAYAPLQPLPAARIEVRTISRLFREARVYVGGEATESRAKNVAADAAILHFATHGILDDVLPLDSALVLTPSANGDGRGEDGYLRAWEILEDMHLDVRLVTLSACDTGLGELLAGEGLLGLTRAFRHAGAASVVASLWQVRDRSTASLMAHFYEGLVAGLPTDEALRRAQLELLRHPAFAHPHHWAAFQIYGDGR